MSFHGNNKLQGQLTFNIKKDFSLLFNSQLVACDTHDVESIFTAFNARYDKLTLQLVAIGCVSRVLLQGGEFGEAGV